MRTIFIITLILIFSNFAYSFEVYNLEGEKQIYFNIANSEIIVKNKENFTNLNILYSIGNTSYSNFYNSTLCPDLSFCANIKLSELFLIDNNSFTGSKEFLLKLGNIEKLIYIDIENPFLKLNNYSINYDDSKLILNISTSDNIGIKEILVYEMDALNFKFIENLTSFENDLYFFKINRSGEYKLKFIVKDYANNIFEKEFIFLIKDFFKPKINQINIIDKYGEKFLFFDLEDDIILNTYSIKKDNLTMSYDIFQKRIEKEEKLPFNKGKFLFSARDNSSNEVFQDLDLDFEFKNTIINDYSNNKEFKIKSNADTCVLIAIDDIKKNISFQKSNDLFYIQLDIKNSKIYSIEYKCSKSFYTKYFKSNFTYDNIPPSLELFDFQINSNEQIRIFWDKASDNFEGELNFILYKNSKKINSAYRNDFIDNDIYFPNTYSYYLIVEDMAGNTFKSKTLEYSPKKIKIDFKEISSKINSLNTEVFLLEFESESNLEVLISIQNNNSIISEEIFFTGSERNFKKNLKLKEGNNLIFVSLKDTYGNIREEIFERNLYFTNNDIIEEIVLEENLEKFETNSSKILESSIISPKIDNEKTNSLFFWVLLILLIFFILTIINLNKIQFSNAIRKIKRKKQVGFEKKRKEDLILKKTLISVKKERIEKQKKKIEEKLKKENTREIYPVEAQKLKEISFKKNSPIDFTSKQNKKFENKNFKRLDVLKKSNLNSSIKKNDEDKFGFKNYLNKVKSAPVWSSTKEYREKYLQEKEILKKEKEEEKLKKQEEQKKLKELKVEENRIKDSEKENQEKRLDNRLSKDKEKRNNLKSSLDDYLNQRKKKKTFYFAEKELEKDLKKRD